LPRLVALLSTNPARVLSLAGGSLSPGVEADVTVLDLTRRVNVSPETFQTKGRNTPFGGWALKGGVALTLVGGRPVFDARIRS